MNTSVIRYRVADFLKTHAPFDAIPEPQLIELAAHGRVKFHEADEYIFRQGQAGAPWVWIIQQGTVELVDESSGASQLRDVLEEGDLLGIERFFGNGAYLSSARSLSDVILYAIEAPAFEDFAGRHAAVKRYLAAWFSVAAADLGRRSWLDAEAPSLAFLQARFPRLKSAGLSTPDSPAIEAPFTTREAVRKMVSTHCDTLAAGSDAILTAADLALFCDRNPPLLLAELRKASCIDELAPLLRQAERLVQDGLAQPSDIDDCARIATEIAAACAAACLRFAHQDAVSAGIEPPPVPFCWVAFGALARGELLRPEAARIGVVYDDRGLEDTIGAIEYFNVVAGYLASWFAACGISGAAPVWPEGAHPCLPLSEWKNFFKETIGEPHQHDLPSRQELLDIRELSGDQSVLAELTAFVARELAETKMLLPLLANDTLAHLPPLTVFHGRVLDSDGAEHQALDLTEAVINPISDAARVFALASPGSPSTGGPSTGGPIDTLGRLHDAAVHFPGDIAVFQNAAEAFRVALYHQTVAGTPLIAPSALGKLDQRAMKTAFSSVLRLLELTASTFVPRL